MTELRWPVRRVLRAGIDDLAIARIWRRLEHSRRRTAATRVPLPRRRLAWISAAIVALGALAVTLLLAGPSARHPADGPLRLASGLAIADTLATAEDARTVDLSDESAVSLRPRSSLEVLENDGKAFGTFLAAGSARFDVHPGGPRRWTIDCGLATVEVIGTRFSIRREPTFVHVEVEHGIVLVRSDLIAERVRRLTEGQSLDVVRAVSPPPPPAPTAAALPAPPAAALSAPPAPTAPPSDAKWRDLAGRGDFRDAYGVLGPSGVRRISERGAVRDLLTVADVARLSGHPREAVPPLMRILEDHPDDPSASLAAFTLGRIQLDALGDAPGAADAFAWALALHLPPELEEAARARLVEARARAGDAAGARHAAEEYRARFPSGSLSAEVTRWANQP